MPPNPQQTLESRVEALEAVVRTQGSRLAQFEDSVSVYGPPKRSTLRFPELNREQRATLALFIVMMALPVFMKMGSGHAS